MLKPKKKEEDEELLDYSHLYSSFYDIFVGHQVDQKQFDQNYALREIRNVYASFVNLMSNAPALQNKIKFDMNPLEKAKRDAHASHFLGGAVPDHFTMIGK